MKLISKYVSFCLLTLLAFTTQAESEGLLEPLKWQIAAEKVDESQIQVTLTAKIDNGWATYSQFNDPDGPVPTFIGVEGSESYSINPDNPAEEISDYVLDGYDPIFEMDVKKFKKQVDYVQLIDIADWSDTVKGFVEFMVCDSTRCLPPTMQDWWVDLASMDAQLVVLNVAQERDTRWPVIGEARTDCGIDSKTDHEGTKSLMLIFILGFGGGLLALLTPCVFPMIPLTVSFFTKQSKTKSKGLMNALLYGLNIIVIYVGIGFLVTVTAGPDVLNAMASNGIFNMVFFLVFIVFAISFFGYFEITLPSSWINKADGASDKGGLIGIFFMAFTLSLVSFSCTGPIIGTLLVEAAISGSTVGPLIGMFGFALALALPFALFAAFPGWLNSLPKSGGWLNSVKVMLGFAEVALAMKFLSNVDLAYHWGFFKREIFVGLWIIIAIAMALYMLGKIKFPHDSPLKKLSATRVIIATVCLAFAGYMGVGMYTGNLSLLSGLAPPGHYSIFEKEGDLHCPHNLECFKDYDKGLAYAKAENKPILLDFTGHTCVNCRKMEDNVWVEEPILEMIADDYVLISLYVDDKVELDKEDQYVSTFTGRNVETVGNKWSDLQIQSFETSSQPYYVLLTPDEELLNQPVGYTPDWKKYEAFLQCGLDAYN